MAIPAIKKILKNRSAATDSALSIDFAPKTIAPIAKNPNDISSFTDVDLANNLELKHI